MAISITKLTVGHAAQDSVEVTTASVTPAGIVLLAINTYHSTAATDIPIPGVTGLGLSWTLLGDSLVDSVGTDRSRLFLFAGTGTPATGSIVITWTSPVPRCNYLVYDVTGAGGSFPGQVAKGVAPSGTSLSGSFSSPIAPGSVAFAVYGMQTDPVCTPGAGWTALDTYNVQAASALFTETATSGSTIAATWTPAARSGFVAVEIPSNVAPPPSGSGTGAVLWSGSASGARASAGASTGTLAWSGSALGDATRSGSAGGALLWSGTASATSSVSGSASGSIDWSGVATGAVSERLGSVEATLIWSGSAEGFRPPDAAWIFLAPATPERVVGQDPLFTKLRIWRGATLLKSNGSYRTVWNPSPEELDAADVIYLGGHTYSVSEQEAASLMAAGYEVTRDE